MIVDIFVWAQIHFTIFHKNMQEFLLIIFYIINYVFYYTCFFLFIFYWFICFF